MSLRWSRRFGGLLLVAVLLGACRDGLTGPEPTLELRGERQHSAVVYNEPGYSELRCGFVEVSARLSGRSKDFASWERATLRLWAIGSGALLGEREFSAAEISGPFGVARIGTGEAQEMAWLVRAGEPFRTTIDYRYRLEGRRSIRTATFDFTCTRPASSITSTFFSYSSEAGDYIGSGWTGHFGAGAGVWLAEAHWAQHEAGVDHVSIRLDDGSQWWNLDFGSSWGDLLVPRRYLNAERWPFHDPPRAGLSVSGNGRGCNTLRGEFTVHELVVGLGGAVERFHAGFKQHCEGDVPALTGEIAVVAEGDVSVNGSAVTAEGAKRGTAGAGGAVMGKGAPPRYFPVLP